MFKYVIYVIDFLAKPFSRLFPPVLAFCSFFSILIQKSSGICFFSPFSFFDLFGTNCSGVFLTKRFSMIWRKIPGISIYRPLSQGEKKLVHFCEKRQVFIIFFEISQTSLQNIIFKSFIFSLPIPSPILDYIFLAPVLPVLANFFNS